MNTRLVNSAAGVINAALARNVTAAGVAMALESVGLLMSPDTAVELAGLRSRVAELEEAEAAAVAVSEVQVRRLHDEMLAGSGLYAALTMPSSPEQVAESLEKFRAVVQREQAPREDDVSPQVQKLRSLLAEQRAVVEDPHDSPLHHSYRLGHDLPESGGAS